MGRSLHGSIYYYRAICPLFAEDMRSLPSRKCGLKSEIAPTLRIRCSVAPFTGAWIEITLRAHHGPTGHRSLPSRERGLKSVRNRYPVLSHWSLPSRERGLKFQSEKESVSAHTSLPSRERGLKLHMREFNADHGGRSLHGSVD